jgi:hypothetical protein
MSTLGATGQDCSTTGASPHSLAGHEDPLGPATDLLEELCDDVNRIHGLHMIYEENRVRRGRALLSHVLTGATGSWTARRPVCSGERPGGNARSSAESSPPWSRSPRP